MKILRFGVLCLPAMCVLGCFGPRLTGEWQGTKPIGPATSQVKYSFTKDSRYTAMNEVSSPLGSLRTAQSGTYEVKGDALTLTQKQATINGVAIQRAEAVTETHKFQVDGDTLILDTDKAAKTVLTRVRK